MKTTRSANPVNPKIGVIGVQTIITAILVLAIALTLSCSSGGDDNGGTSSPSVGDVSSSSNGSSSPSVAKEVIATSYYTQIIYDANGGVSSTSTSRYEYEYDSKGNVTKQVPYDADGNILGRYEYEYDSKGNVTKQVYYNADGVAGRRSEYEYDSYGNLTKIVGYNADGNVSSRTEYEYDSNGNQTKQVNYIADGSVYSRTEYDCNSDGSFCTYTLYNNKEEISYTGEARYTTINSKKFTVSRIFYTTSPSGGSSKEEYEYDSMGNITKATQYSRQSDTDSYRKTSETTTTYTYTRI